MAGGEPCDGPVAIGVVADLAVPASWRKVDRERALAGSILPQGRPDVDNYAKAALDALNGVCFLDDAQVVVLTARKRYAAAAALHIEVERA